MYANTAAYGMRANRQGVVPKAWLVRLWQGAHQQWDTLVYALHVSVAEWWLNVLERVQSFRKRGLN